MPGEWVVGSGSWVLGSGSCVFFLFSDRCSSLCCDMLLQHDREESRTPPSAAAFQKSSNSLNQLLLYGKQTADLSLRPLWTTSSTGSLIMERRTTLSVLSQAALNAKAGPSRISIADNQLPTKPLPRMSMAPTASRKSSIMPSNSRASIMPRYSNFKTMQFLPMIYFTT